MKKALLSQMGELHLNRTGPSRVSLLKGRKINGQVSSKGVSQDSLEGLAQAVLVDQSDRSKGVSQVSLKDLTQEVVVEQSDRNKTSQGNFHCRKEANQ